MSQKEMLGVAHMVKCEPDVHVGLEGRINVTNIHGLAKVVTEPDI